MWKDYLSGHIKNNGSSSLSIRLSAFIAALFLSILCGLFYNAWKYEVERIEQEEGGWHSRIIGEFAVEDIEAVKNFANVKDAVVNGKESEGTELVLDIYFDDMGSVFSDTPHIAKQMGVAPEKIVYHYELLAMYLIRDSSDPAPRLLFPLFILIVLLASFSLIVIIHHSFAVSMNARIHQFGIFSSIGATPKQIRGCLLQEAAALCAVPVLVGNLIGIVCSMGVMALSNLLLGKNLPGRHEAVPGYHPLVLLMTLSVTALTIWLSAWWPARKLSKLTPLEAIKNTSELQLKRKKNSYVFTLLFGVEGELAGNALKAQRRALRTASLSFLFAFMAFTIMQCFFALSKISTRETYFERYQKVWDIMVTVKESEVDTCKEMEAIQKLTGVESAIMYQKAKAKRIITEEEMSEAMKSFGGFTHASGNYVTQIAGGWLVNAPIVILDDSSFLAYCERIGIAPRVDGTVILNRIRDVTNPDFRHPDFMPYLKAYAAGEDKVSDLRQAGREEMTAKLQVLCYTEEVPDLRESYATLDYYELVHFMPVSLWRKIKGQIGGVEEDSYICVRAKREALEELNILQEEICRLVGQNYAVECENRIQEYEINNKQIQGIMTVFGGFCVLLAVIGVGSVFSNTVGFMHQRKREFARYMSIGMTAQELRKMLCIEALVIAGRPILISFPLAIIAVGYMLKLSYVGVGEFLAEAPFTPIVIFMIAILGSIALAYSLAWRNIRTISLAEVLRDDTMM